MMREVLLLGVVRERCGVDRVEIELPEEATVATVREVLSPAPGTFGPKSPSKFEVAHASPALRITSDWA